MPQPVLDLPFVKDLAEAAGVVMLRHFRFSGIARQFKDEGTANATPVTVADLEVNRMVIERIRQHLSDQGLSNDVSIEGEEESDRRAGARYRVVCDPIDGTFPYAHGIPVSTFMLAVLDNGVPVRAVIFDPFGKQMHLAERGAGATLNGETIRVSPATELTTKSVIGSVWWNTAPFNVGLLMGLMPALHGASVMNLLSVGYMGAKVATGEFAATVFPGGNAHDNAAIHLLVEEAGGKFTDLFGNVANYDAPLKGHIAANPTLHKKLLKMVASLNPPAP